MFFIGKFKRYLSINFITYIIGRFVFFKKLKKSINQKSKTRKFFPEKNDFIMIDSNKNEIINNLNFFGVSNQIKLSKKINKYILDNYEQSLFISKKIHGLEEKKFKGLNKLINSSNKNLPFFDLKNKKFEKLFSRISLSKDLFELAETYLGKINGIDIRLNYSSVVDLDDNSRENYRQTVKWHYDVHALNFLYAFFYISGSDEKSGAHQVIKGSHNNKSLLKHMFGSVIQKDRDLRNYYKKKNFFIIKGQKGRGFLEDTSCFHRALKPILKPRLCLQIRYH